MNPAIYIPQSKRLMEQLSGVLRYKHYSLKTEQAYCYWVRFCPLVWAWRANAASARHGRSGGDAVPDHARQ